MNAGRTKRCMRAIRTRFGLLDGGFESPVRAFLRSSHPPGYPGQVAVAAFERRLFEDRVLPCNREPFPTARS